MSVYAPFVLWSQAVHGKQGKRPSHNELAHKREVPYRLFVWLVLPRPSPYLVATPNRATRPKATCICPLPYNLAFYAHPCLTTSCVHEIAELACRCNCDAPCKPLTRAASPATELHLPCMSFLCLLSLVHADATCSTFYHRSRSPYLHPSSPCFPPCCPHLCRTGRAASRPCSAGPGGSTAGSKQGTQERNISRRRI